MLSSSMARVRPAAPPTPVTRSHTSSLGSMSHTPSEASTMNWSTCGRNVVNDTCVQAEQGGAHAAGAFSCVAVLCQAMHTLYTKACRPCGGADRGAIPPAGRTCHPVLHQDQAVQQGCWRLCCAQLTSGSDVQPTVEAMRSPREREMSRPGERRWRSHMRGSPTSRPLGSRCGCTRAPAATTLHGTARVTRSAAPS